MPTFINVADLHDPNDPQGRTYREVNAAKTHAIAIGSLVEIKHDPEDDTDSGVRLYVVCHGRDCDKTPLYYLSHRRDDTTMERPGFRNHSWVGGYSEESLVVVPSVHQTELHAHPG